MSIHRSRLKIVLFQYTVVGMPHISPRHLHKKIVQKIQKQLMRTLLRLDSQFRAQFFIQELLTETEQVMLAKRLALIFLLKKEYSYVQIQRILQLSPTTIDKFQKRLCHGDFDTIMSHIKTNKKESSASRSFWKEFQELLDLPVFQNDYITRPRL